MIMQQNRDERRYGDDHDASYRGCTAFAAPASAVDIATGKVGAGSDGVMFERGLKR
jgi:hypothetical protein